MVGFVAAGGALVVLGLLVRNLLRHREAVRKAEHTDYMRHSYMLSHIVSGSLILSWIVAAYWSLVLGDVRTASYLMIGGPLACALLLMAWATAWRKRHPDAMPPQMLEIESQIEELRNRRDRGEINEMELQAAMFKLMQKSRGISY